MNQSDEQPVPQEIIQTNQLIFVFDGATFQYPTEEQFNLYKQAVMQKLSKYDEDSIQTSIIDINRKLLQGKPLSKNEQYALKEANIALHYVPELKKMQEKVIEERDLAVDEKYGALIKDMFHQKEISEEEYPIFVKNLSRMLLRDFIDGNKFPSEDQVEKLITVLTDSITRQ